MTYDLGSEVRGSGLISLLANPDGASVIRYSGISGIPDGINPVIDLSQPVMTFDMTVVDASKPIELTVATTAGGHSVFQLGTNGDDTMVATDVDNIIRGQDGSDAIDVSAAGRDIIVFEADPAANGIDIVTGFTIGPSAEVTDAIMFSGLSVGTLRGDGTDVETLAVGDAIGADTGVVGLTTTLSDLSQSTIETAVESFAGLQTGDEIYVMATDGTDSVLVKVDYSAPNSASVETVAQFTGLDDLTGLSTDNILHTDPTGATA